MKKKIKDLTISDILKYCDNTNCEDCIFNIEDECEAKFAGLHLDQEIEVDSDENKKTHK